MGTLEPLASLLHETVLNETTIAPSALALNLPPYLTYVIFGQNVAMIGLQLATIPLDVNLLVACLCYPQRLSIDRRLPQTLLILISLQLLFCIISMPSCLYAVLWWRPPTSSPRSYPIYNQDLLFGLGVWRSVNVSISPAAGFFLTLERYLELKYGERIYETKDKRTLLALELVTFAVICAILFLLWREELPIDYERVAYCEHLGCHFSKSIGVPLLYIKIIFGVMNLGFGLFYIGEQRKMCFARRIRRIDVEDLAVRTTLALEVGLNLAPSLIAIIVGLITRRNDGHILGPHTTTSSFLAAFLCALFYSHILLRRKRRQPGQPPKRKSALELCARMGSITAAPVVIGPTASTAFTAEGRRVGG